MCRVSELCPAVPIIQQINPCQRCFIQIERMSWGFFKMYRSVCLDYDAVWWHHDTLARTSFSEVHMSWSRLPQFDLFLSILAHCSWAVREYKKKQMQTFPINKLDLTVQIDMSCHNYHHVGIRHALVTLSNTWQLNGTDVRASPILKQLPDGTTSLTDARSWPIALSHCMLLLINCLQTWPNASVVSQNIAQCYMHFGSLKYKHTSVLWNMWKVQYLCLTTSYQSQCLVNPESMWCDSMFLAY